MHLPHMVTTRIPPWLCRSQGSRNLLDLKEASEIMAYMQRLLQRTQYPPQRPSSAFQGVRTKTKALYSLCQSRYRPQNHLKTRALRHEHQSVPIHQSQHAISLLLDFHPSPQSIALSRITKAMHPLPLFPLRATQSVTRLKRILAALHLS